MWYVFCCYRYTNVLEKGRKVFRKSPDEKSCVKLHHCHVENTLILGFGWTILQRDTQANFLYALWNPSIFIVSSITLHLSALAQWEQVYSDMSHTLMQYATSTLVYSGIYWSFNFQAYEIIIVVIFKFYRPNIIFPYRITFMHANGLLLKFLASLVFPGNCL